MEMFFSYFSNFKLQDGNIPSGNYINKLKYQISFKLREEYLLDLFTGEFYKAVSDRWKVVMHKLYGKINCMQCEIEFIDDITL